MSKKIVTFATMNANVPDMIKWSENVVIADADYIDAVAFDLIVNFERIIGRRIPKADMAQWCVCAALDGGLRPGKHETQVVLVHDKGKKLMENFAPAVYDTELSGQAFDDEQLGEFALSSIPAGEVASKDEIIIDLVKTVLTHKEVKRLIIVPNAIEGDLYDTLRSTLHNVDDDEKRVTLLTMQPMAGGNFRQEILGYSLMQALGIKADELK